MSDEQTAKLIDATARIERLEALMIKVMSVVQIPIDPGELELRQEHTEMDGWQTIEQRLDRLYAAAGFEKADSDPEAKE